jgi:hypothetical protein
MENRHAIAICSTDFLSSLSFYLNVLKDVRLISKVSAWTMHKQNLTLFQLLVLNESVFEKSNTTVTVSLVQAAG